MSIFSPKCERCRKNTPAVRDDVLFPGKICLPCERLIKIARLAGGKLHAAVVNSTKTRDEIRADFVRQLEEIESPHARAQDVKQRRDQAKEIEEIITILSGV